MVRVFVTEVAASALADLAPGVKQPVVEFLDKHLDKFTGANLPTDLPGLDGKYWIVKPSSDGPTLVLTTNPGSEDEYVLTALLPNETIPDIRKAGDDRSEGVAAEIGAKVFEAQVVAE